MFLIAVLTAHMQCAKGIQPETSVAPLQALAQAAAVIPILERAARE